MSFGITVQREISNASVTFTATLDSAQEALDTAALLATGKPAATAAEPTKTQPAASGKKDQTPADTAKSSPEKQTLTASGNSDSSLTASENGSKAAGADKAEEASALDYEKHIKPLVLAIAKISREKAEALLQRFGVASAKALKPEQFADFKAKADQVIAGTYDPVASDEEAIA